MSFEVVLVAENEEGNAREFRFLEETGEFGAGGGERFAVVAVENPDDRVDAAAVTLPD